MVTMFRGNQYSCRDEGINKINNLNNLIQQLIPLATTQRAARDYYLKDNERQLGSYLAIRLERSASFASLIRLYVNYCQFLEIF